MDKTVGSGDSPAEHQFPARELPVSLVKLADLMPPPVKLIDLMPLVKLADLMPPPVKLIDLMPLVKLADLMPPPVKLADLMPLVKLIDLMPLVKLADLMPQPVKLADLMPPPVKLADLMPPPVKLIDLMPLVKLADLMPPPVKLIDLLDTLNRKAVSSSTPLPLESSTSLTSADVVWALQICAFVLVIEVLFIGWSLAADVGPEARAKYVEIIGLIMAALEVSRTIKGKRGRGS